MRVVYDVDAEADLLSLEPTSAIEILDCMDRFASDGTGFVRRMIDEDGVCDTAVSFRYHEDDAVEPAADDFLEFVAQEGLRLGR